jgi:hypothetical protein
MTFESSFDRASMFSPSDWGRKAVYKNKGKRFTINGIFDSNYQLVDVAEVGFSSSTPIFTIPTAALPCKPVVGDSLFVDCDEYTVRNFKADGTGVTVLQLEYMTNLDRPELKNILLLQDGGNLLTEDGAYLVQETGNI